MTSSQNWLLILVNFLGGILFLVGSARFLSINDVIGTVVFAMAGVIAIVLAGMNLSRLKKNPS